MNDRTIRMWSHADIRSIHEQIAIFDRFAQNSFIAKIMQRYMTIRLFVERLYDLLGTIIKRILDIEHMDLLNTIQSRLH